MAMKPTSRIKQKKLKRYLVMMLAMLMVSQNVIMSVAAIPQTVEEPERATESLTMDSVEEEKSADIVNGEESGALVPDDAMEEEKEEIPSDNEGDNESGDVNDSEAGDNEEDMLPNTPVPEEPKPDDTGKEEIEEDSEPDKGDQDNTPDQDNSLTEDSEQEESLADKVASPSDATPKDIFMDMPKIGQNSFTDWFFSHTDSEELWDWVALLLVSEDKDDEDVVAFLKWFEVNKDKVEDAYKNFFGIALFASSTGDLWNDWLGNTHWTGDGTESAPYEINDLSDLCGLSEMVAAGNSFANEYFMLTQDIDVGNLTANRGNWNPIGWYQIKADLGKEVEHKFKGNFDGGGNTISGLKISSVSNELNNIGLFGAVEGGSIKNLIVSADNGMTGGDNVGVLAGSVSGDTIIYNVTVENSYLSAKGDVGGLVGQITGKANAAKGTVTIENCTADGIAIQQTEGVGAYIGGIAGNVQNANIVDVSVRTYDGGDRIQGKGYTGGVVGRLNRSNIFNSYVSGTIGGNGGQAVGGIIGKYDSGNMFVARFAGTIGLTNQGSATREGTFVGTRDAANKFTYGTGKNDNFAYLFATTGALAKKPFGSNIDADNTFTTDAHIGYWESTERKFHLVAGSVDKEITDRYYYEELEAGVKHVVINKLSNNFGVQVGNEYWKGCDYKLDHFAPNSYGAPIRGYLVSIPRIDTRNANGSYDTDVASLTAIGRTGNAYYKAIDMDNPSAVAYGDVIEVSTAAKDRNGNRYQMVYDENEPGKVKPPTFTDEESNTQDMTYINGGAYTFTMPEADTELNVEYVKVTTALTMSPEKTVIKVVQTRSGDRKNPQLETIIYDENGKQISKYIGDVSQVTPMPVAIHAEHNGAGNTNDKSVKWSVDNSNLLTLSNVDTATYTIKDAYVMPSLSSTFIVGIIDKKVQEQVNSGYAEAIDNTIYTDVATVTATTNPATSVNNIAVVGNTRVDVTFQIVDNTTRRVEGLNLSYSDIELTVTRKLTGDRTNPVEVIECSEPSILTATLYPVQPFNKNVSWVDTQAGSIILVEPYGNNNKDCSIRARYDQTGKANPAWIQNVINADNQKRKDDKYVKLDGSASYSEIVTATAEDQTHGIVTAKCNVKINFTTIDNTVIHPQSVKMSQDKLVYNLSFTMAGDIKSAKVADSGFVNSDLDCTVTPIIADDNAHKPYDSSVTWSVSEPEVLTVDQAGNIIPNKNAQWIKDAMANAPYAATKTVDVYATANDKTNSAMGKTTVTLNFSTNCIELSDTALVYNINLVMAGKRTEPTYRWTGIDAKKIVAIPYQDADAKVTYQSSSDAITITEDGTINPVLNLESEWMKPAMSSPYTATTVFSIAATDGRSTDTCEITLNLKVTDNTTSYNGGGGSGGGGGGGGGGGSTTTGVTPGGGPASATAKLPSYVVSGGTWVQNTVGKWLFTDSNRTYANEWGAIHNPYANISIGQSPFNWFRFDQEGFMMTGWYTDEKGDLFYLNPVSDNTLGRMMTGWYWIKGADGVERCYYFNEVSDGTSGKLMKNTVIGTDMVNEHGEWTVDGVVQVR